MEVSQQKADEDEDARKSPEDHFHNIIYLLPLPCHGEKPKARLSIDVVSAAPYQKSRDTNREFAVEGTEAGTRDDTL